MSPRAAHRKFVREMANLKRLILLYPNSEHLMDRKVKFDEIEQEYEAFKEVYEPD